jgi:predicted lipoprotein with Yx(FWY)xxD motif
MSTATADTARRAFLPADRRAAATGAIVAAVGLTLAAALPAHAETQGYVIQWIHTATDAQPDNCPQGGNGERAEVQRKILLSRGYTPEQATQIITYYGETVDGMNAPPPYHGPKFDFNERGKLFGKTVDVGNFPSAEPDPQIETAQGRYMYGFDLTGKPVSYSFEDPETHQRVEDQMWRVLGCFASFHVPLSVIPYAESLTWETAEDAMPAWLISISGADLSHDGDVTVTFDRALDIVSRNTYGGALRDASYTVDPDPRSHSVFKGHIKDGIVSIEPGDLYLLGERPFYQVLRFSQTHLRLKLHPDPSTLYYGGEGVVGGFVGGYQPWLDYFHFLATPGEEESHVEIAGVYDAMKRLADGVPDPKTGENTAISAAYYFEAAPVFLTHVLSANTVSREHQAAAVASARPQAPATTPPGITMVEVQRSLFLSEPQILWLRPGDADGRTLFTFDRDHEGSSSCLAACAEEFLPLLAPLRARASGDWSLVRRPDGARQWAYQSHPLYTWVKEKTPGEVATNVGLTETANLKLAEEAVEIGSLLPPANWHVARFAFSAGVIRPDGIAVNRVPSAGAVALTDAQGMTLYGFEGSATHDGQDCSASGCDPLWRPLLASELASRVADFTVVTRTDGSKQWAYRRRPLYLYRGDKLPGDMYGVGVDPRWGIAAIAEDFRPQGVSVQTLNGYGDVLSLNGMTLYGGHVTDSRNGGYSLRGNYAFLYAQDKRLGGAACVDAPCLQVWHPFLAPADAQSNGFWEPITRADGTKQWAYKGCALYTYSGDETPGDHNGQGLIDYATIEGSAAELKRALFFADFKDGRGSLGVYWSIAKP